MESSSAKEARQRKTFEKECEEIRREAEELIARLRLIKTRVRRLEYAMKPVG